MGRLIDEQMVLDRLHKYFATGFAEDRWWNSTHVLTAINETPSAQPERKKGEWVLKPHEKMLAWDCEPFSYDETYNPKRHSVIEMIYHCPTCNYEVGDTKPIWKFCPMCGTDIREGD